LSIGVGEGQAEALKEPRPGLAERRRGRMLFSRGVHGGGS